MEIKGIYLLRTGGFQEFCLDSDCRFLVSWEDPFLILNFFYPSIVSILFGILLSSIWRKKIDFLARFFPAHHHILKILFLGKTKLSCFLPGGSSVRHHCSFFFQPLLLLNLMFFRQIFLCVGSNLLWTSCS